MKQRSTTVGVTTRRDYEESRSRDYTRYTSLIGESLASKVDVLAKILGDAHAPSLGRYKERLLSEAIASYIPRRYEVATGFVLFPHERQFRGDRPPAFDHLNVSDFTPSLQCDIVVFDASQYPPVFRDGEFVVVRPESVRAVVEVKGSLSHQSASEAISNMIDFGIKWRQCSDFYIRSHEKPLRKPYLGVMAWRMAVDSAGVPRTNGRRLRGQLVKSYSRLPRNLLRAFPVLDSFSLYSVFEVSATTWEAEDESFSFGFFTGRGRAIRFSDSGEAEIVGDSTVSSLLAGIHSSLETPHNRFFARGDQSNWTSLFPHQDQGYSPWLTGDDTNLPYADLEGDV
jgi:hypothetical protein